MPTESGLMNMAKPDASSRMQSFGWLFALLFIAGCLILQPLTAAQETPQSQPQPFPQQDETAEDTEEVDDWTEQDIVAAQQLSQQLSVAEWLGPMAPVALSPFFGIMLLSGLSFFGGDWIAPDNPLIGQNSPLHHAPVFWTFFVLTVLTSVPRFTKVSKPIAQALDQLEAWSGIITMVTLRILISMKSPDPETTEAVQAGLFDLSTNVLLMIAAGINIFVINAVKFFFEILIWITPIPLIDAAWEILNKLFCLALISLYAFSPTLATLFNLAMFAFCLVVLTWVHRREIFFRSMLLDALRPLFSPQEPGSSIIVFPERAVGPIKPRARCELERTGNGWKLIHHRFLRSSLIVELNSSTTPPPQIHQGLFTNSLVFAGSIPCHLTFSRRFNARLSSLADQLAATFPVQESEAPTTLRTEFA